MIQRNTVDDGKAHFHRLTIPEEEDKVLGLADIRLNIQGRVKSLLPFVVPVISMELIFCQQENRHHVTVKSTQRYSDDSVYNKYSNISLVQVCKADSKVSNRPCKANKTLSEGTQLSTCLIKKIIKTKKYAVFFLTKYTFKDLILNSSVDSVEQKYKSLPETHNVHCTEIKINNPITRSL